MKKSVFSSNIISNTLWLFFEKLYRMGLGFIVVIFLARYLGPADYGLLNYAIALIAMLAPFHQLGLTSISVKEIVRNPSEKSRIIGTIFFTKLAASLLAFIVSFTLILFLRPGNNLLLVITSILASSYFFQSFEVIDFYFRSKVYSKAPVIARTASFTITSILKLSFILGGLSLIYFAFANLIEYVIAAFLLVLFYISHKQTLFKWNFDISCVKELLSESWPLYLSTFFVLIYLQIDQVMIGQILDDQKVGVYSAVVRISSLWYFIPTAISFSLQPTFFKNTNNNEVFYKNIQTLFTFLAFLAYAISIPIALFSNIIISCLFGSDFSAAGPVLAIHIFSSIFVFFGVARSLWILQLSETKFQLISTTSGALSNVALNLFLIKAYGITGAAYATLISYFIVSMGSNLFYTKARRILIIQIRAIFLLDISRVLKTRHFLATSEG